MATLASNITLAVGSFTSSTFTVPASMPQTKINFVVAFSQAQLDDPTQGFQFQVQRLDGATWINDFGFTWVGGLITPSADNGNTTHQIPIAFTWDVSGLLGKQVRFSVIGNKKSVTGITITDTFI